MGAALQVVWQALRDLNIRGYAYIWSNFLFVVLCIPVITAPAAFSALMYTGYVGHTKSFESELESFWGAFKQHWLRAFFWGLGHLVFALIHLTNILFYAGPDSVLTSILRTFWALITVIWVGTIFYTWPIYYSMKTPSLLGATRNAIIMVLQNPIFTMTLIFVMVLISLLSTLFIVAWILLTWGVFSSISNAAVVNRLRPYLEDTPPHDITP